MRAILETLSGAHRVTLHIVVDLLNTISQNDFREDWYVDYWASAFVSDVHRELQFAQLALKMSNAHLRGC